MTVTLREVRVEDFPTLFANQADPVAVQLAMVFPREHQAFEAHWNQLLVDPEVLSRAIVADGQLAGHVGAWNRDGERQVGYALGRAFWGRGIATAALAQLLALEPHRPLQAHVAKENIGSWRVLEKCGFSRVKESLEPADNRFPEFVDLTYRLD